MASRIKVGQRYRVVSDSTKVVPGGSIGIAQPSMDFPILKLENGKYAGFWPEELERVTFPRGKALMKAVINYIIDNPNKWNQRSTHDPVSKTHCFCGIAQILGGGNPEIGNTLSEAIKFLKLPMKDMEYLYSPDRTFPELYYFVASGIKGGERRIRDYPKL